MREREKSVDRAKLVAGAAIVVASVASHVGLMQTSFVIFVSVDILYPTLKSYKA